METARPAMSRPMMDFSGWGEARRGFDPARAPQFFPFLHGRTGLTPDRVTPPVDPATVAVPPSRATPALLAALRAALPAGEVAADDAARRLHAYGKSYRDLLRARRGELARAPDAVVFPDSHSECEALVAVARAHGAKLVPFGGGTNIVGGVEVPAATTAPAVTVSLRRMNRLLALDEVSGVATLEAGILGPDLEAALNARGFTLGHFPDSFEWSTLGGWLATRSAGMQSDTRGKIEDMVVALKLVTPTGTLVTRAVPRAAAGPDLNQLAVGSEGVLGLITEATMRVYRVPAREYRGLLLPSFAAGVEFMRRCTHEGVPPATMRLSNCEETALGLRLKPPAPPLKHAFTRAVGWYLRAVRGFRLGEMCLLILGWEGAPAEIARRRAAALALARECGAFDAGRGAGDAWFARKYDYPYLRDCVMQHGGMADVTEGTVLWRDALPAYEKVSAALRAHLRRGEFPGYVGCHLSHAYAAGVCVYFTFAAARDEADPFGQYERAKSLAVEAMLAAGASLSHHHGVGTEHLPWMARYTGETGLRALRGLKTALDPEDLFNPGKLLPPP